MPEAVIVQNADAPGTSGAGARRFRPVVRAAALAATICLAALVGCGANAWWFKPVSLNVFYERIFLRYLLRDPELLTSLGVLRPLGITRFDAHLTDVSDRQLRANNAFTRSELATLRRYDTLPETPSQRLSSAILGWYLDDVVRGQAFEYHAYSVNALNGVQVELPVFMASQHPLRNSADARHYISRLTQFGRKFDQVLEGLRIRDQRGLVPPRVAIEAVLAQSRAFVSTPVRSNLLYTSFAARLDAAYVGPAERTRLLADAASAIARSVYPAYQKLIAFEDSLAGKAGDAVGAWHLPDGDRYYAWALRHHTTTDLPPDSVHALGRAIVGQIEADMVRRFDSLGIRGATVGARLRVLAADPRLQYPADSAGRAQSLADATALIARAERGVASQFAHLPPARVVVVPVPKFREAAETGGSYAGGSADGSRPGVFFMNLAKQRTRWQLPTLVHHEAVPGHHLQGATALKLTGVPTFRRVIPFTAYGEGWGLYAEDLAYELGLDGDVYGVLGYEELRLLRAARLVVDTGLHAEHWSRAQAIEYLSARMADTALARSEVDRYIVDPGQACAYVVGELMLLDLRERARRELGPRFDIRQFHSVILENGQMPLAILEGQVNAYIAETRARR